jgi:hypothetical protein
MASFTNEYGQDVLYLHYSADPTKDKAWAERERAGMTNPALYDQEYEINFSATSGELIYQLIADATLEKTFPIPHEWTRYSVLDPHPRVPHAMLWGAVDPEGDVWVYREFWPSKMEHGRPGNIPEDDNRVSIKQFLQIIQYLESSENPENHGTDENIYRRVIDYAARSFGQGTTDDPDQPNFQQRFESIGRELDMYMRFEDAKKDRGVGFETVNEWLRPRPYADSDGGIRMRSKLHIFQDECKELLYEISEYRHKPLTPLQAETQDPSPLPIKKRDHLCDCLRYLLMEKPEYIGGARPKSTWKPMREGVAY